MAADRRRKPDRKDAGKVAAARKKRPIVKRRKETRLAHKCAKLDPTFEHALAEGTLVEDFGKWSRKTSG